MYKVVLIGAGELGSRHLQGLLKIDVPVSLEIVDSNEDSLTKSKNRANEVLYNKNIVEVKYLNDIELISKNIDICIIATTANVRYQIILKLLDISIVRNLILEKILFQNLEYYNKINNILLANNVKCWVNCPRRFTDFYQNFKIEIGTKKILSFEVNGSNWGLACNTIHFVDLFSFLTDELIVKYLKNSDLEVVPAKRIGCFEIYGKLNGEVDSGINTSFTCVKENNIDLVIKIETIDLIYVINETRGEYVVKSKINNEVLKQISFQIPFQSEMTNKICADIFQKENCNLTLFSDSVSHHLPMLDAFQSVFFKENIIKDIKICPIT